jgi:hypothetical protein
VITKYPSGRDAGRVTAAWTILPNPGRLDGDTRTAASAPPGSVEKSEEDGRHDGSRYEVPRPGSKDAEQRPLGRLVAQVHVVATRQCVDAANERRVADCDQPHSQHRSRPGHETLTDDEEHGGADDGGVSHDVLDESETRPSHVQIGCQQGLQRARKPPEICDIHEEDLPGEQRHCRHEGSNVAQGEGK